MYICFLIITLQFIYISKKNLYKTQKQVQNSLMKLKEKQKMKSKKVEVSFFLSYMFLENVFIFQFFFLFKVKLKIIKKKMNSFYFF